MRRIVEHLAVIARTSSRPAPGRRVFEAAGVDVGEAPRFRRRGRRWLRGELRAAVAHADDADAEPVVGAQTRPVARLPARPVATLPMKFRLVCMGLFSLTCFVDACLVKLSIVFKRVIWIVLDSVGVGEMPDAAAYGDAGSDTLGNIARQRGLARAESLPPGAGQSEADRRTAAGRAARRRLRPLHAGLARQGHHHRPLGDGRHPSREAVSAVSARLSAARSWTSSSAASDAPRSATKPRPGTEIIKELGEEHMRTGSPIVYTSADSVFQIAAHEEVIPLPELYRMCEIAREILRGPYEVGRVIARPFEGTPGAFQAHRQPARLRRAAAARACCSTSSPSTKVEVYSVGKIFDVFLGRGIGEHVQDQEQCRRHGEDARSHEAVRRAA